MSFLGSMARNLGVDVKWLKNANTQIPRLSLRLRLRPDKSLGMTLSGLFQITVEDSRRLLFPVCGSLRASAAEKLR
jgi:hypothetical protein